MLPRSQGHWQFSSMVTNVGSFWTVAGLTQLHVPLSNKCLVKSVLVETDWWL